MNSFPDRFTDLKEIRINQRFGTYSAVDHKSGEKVFIKQVVNQKLSSSLHREIYGLERIAQLSRIHDFPFEFPKIIGQGEDYLVTTWADGDIMPFDTKLPDLEERSSFLVDCFLSIDKTTQLVNPGRAVFSSYSDGNKGALERMTDSIIKIDTDAFFEPSLVKNTLKYLEVNMPLLTSRFTHADLTPNNIVEKDGTRTLIDWESASEVWPRFYDLVNFTFNKTIHDVNLRQTLRSMVDLFFEGIQSSPEEHMRQINTIAAVRAVSTIIELMTEPDHFHNTQEEMTEARASQIGEYLENILNNKIYI